MKNIKILYLAKYAPIKNNLFIKNEYVSEYVQYHSDLYGELKKHCTIILSNSFDDIIKYKNDIDFIFSVYNNSDFLGSEILSSTLASYYEIPCLGSTPNIRAIAEDKHLAKLVATAANVKTPKWKLFSKPEQLEYVDLDFDPPYFIKPRYGANSDYIDEYSIQNTWEGAKTKAYELLCKGIETIVEEFIDGIYYTVPAWYEDSVHILQSIREFSDKKIVTHNQKIYLESGLSRSFNTNKKLQEALEKVVTSLYNLLLPLDFARFDFIVNEDTNDIFFIEINICCSLSKHSTFASAAKLEGYEYDEFIKKILYISFKRQNLLDSVDLMG